MNMWEKNNYIECQYNLYKSEKSSCNGCGFVQTGIRSASKSTQKQIWNQTGISGGLYSMDIAALTVAKQRIQSGQDVNWNQMSDRQKAGVQTSIIPSHGSSTRGNVTRLRPGSLSPGGIGVDVKNGSYARYLALKKSYNLKAGVPQNNNSVTPITGNKTYPTNAVSGSDACVCISPKILTLDK